MLIKNELAKELTEKVLNVCMIISKDAHEFIGNHDILKQKSYYKYPVSSIEHFKKSDAFNDDIKEKVHFFKFEIPKYYLTDIPEEMENYDSIFNGYQDEKIHIQQYECYKELVEWIDNNSDIKALFSKGNRDSLEYELRKLITNCVERYLFIIKATFEIPDDARKQMSSIVNECIGYYLDEILYIDICIPVCLAVFEEDNIVLSDNIEIVRMTEQFQKSRQKACTYETVGEDWVAACATHMIILHNYYYNKVGGFSLNAVTQDYNYYPLQEIDKVFGIIRLVTGYRLGYEQILSRPISWMYDSCADLPVVYGAKAHFVHPSEIKKYWMNMQVSVINKEQCKRIKELFLKYGECKEKIQFALSRYNRCMLRDDIDDMSTDACIGLESLLAGGTKGEITYTISNRIPIVFANIGTELYSASNCRMLMKKIYNFRSKIVHGGTLKENDKYVTINDFKAYVPKMAVDFLRYTLVFMIENPEYLDVSKIDIYIDKAVSCMLTKNAEK